MFGEIMIFMHYSFRNFYLDFLLLKFFDNESLNAASCNRSEGFTLSGEDVRIFDMLKLIENCVSTLVVQQ